MIETVDKASKQRPIFLTGAGRRVGFYMAQKLYEDGYPLVLHYRTLTDELKTFAEDKEDVHLVYAELSKESDCYALVDAVKEVATDLTAIIHNASSYEPTDRDDMAHAMEQYRLFFGVHMMAPFILNEGLKELLKNSEGRDAEKENREQKRGNIIHITDINVENPNPVYDIYCSTKAGLSNLTQSLAKRYAPDIRVNAVAPGPIMFLPTHTDEQMEKVMAETPLGFEGGPNPIYLAVKSILANEFMTGSTVTVDGGRSLTHYLLP